MGVSVEWFSVYERLMIAREIYPDLKDAKSRGDRLTGPCPFHAEKSRGGAFFYSADKDAYRCFSCGAGGDLIGLYAHQRGLAPDDADAFKDFKKKYAPDWVLDNKLPRPPKPKDRAAGRGYVWKAPEVLPPDQLWRARAGDFVKNAAERLWQHRDVLLQLKGWGFRDRETIKAAGLGYNDRDKWVSPEAWGLEPGKKIYLAKGLVLPYRREGVLVRVKIRCDEPLDGVRYRLVRGSGNQLFHYPGGRHYVVVVETERDAAMLWGLSPFRDFTLVGTGSASARPDAWLDRILKQADIILLALDNDLAGIKNYKTFWLKNYPTARLWPIPKTWGKDPGEAAQNGHDLLAWLMAGVTDVY